MNVVLSGSGMPLRLFYFLRSSSFYAHVYDGPPKKMPVAGKKIWDAHKVVFLALLITCAWHKTQHGIIIQRNSLPPLEIRATLQA